MLPVLFVFPAKYKIRTLGRLFYEDIEKWLSNKKKYLKKSLDANSQNLSNGIIATELQRCVETLIAHVKHSIVNKFFYKLHKTVRILVINKLNKCFFVLIKAQLQWSTGFRVQSYINQVSLLLSINRSYSFCLIGNDFSTIINLDGVTKGVGFCLPRESP